MSALLEVTSRVVVRATPDQVFETAVDWSRQHEWIWATRVRGGRGVGAEVSARTGIGPAGFTDTMVISEWDPPRRCVVRHTGSVVRGSGVFEVVPRGRQCEFSWSERLELPRIAAGFVGHALIRWPAQRALDMSLRRFARLVSAP